MPKVIELDPKNSRAHLRFGDVLKKYRRRNEAIVEYTKAIELAPKDFQAHFNLGWTLKGVGRLDEAVIAYTKAIELAPNDSQAHLALARILFDNGHVDDAIVALRNALELNPHDYTIQYEIGNFFYRAHRLDEAIAEYKRAIEIFPFHLLPNNYAYVHTELGKALQDKGRLDEAIAEFQKVIAVIPINDFAGVTAHVRLVKALHDRGRLDEAIAEYKKMIEFLPERRFNDKENLAMLEPIAAALQSKLRAFLEGKYEPRDNAERLVFARLCILRKYYRSAALLFADAFDAKPKWASDLEAGERYDAARSAVLAAAGRGNDARQLPDKSVAVFRRWALNWLREDLTAYAKLAAQNDSTTNMAFHPMTNMAIQQRLAHWRRDPDLASVRDPSALNRLPDSERAAWQALWRDVDELAKRVAKTSEPKAAQNKPKR